MLLHHFKAPLEAPQSGLPVRLLASIMEKFDRRQPCFGLVVIPQWTMAPGAGRASNILAVEDKLCIPLERGGWAMAIADGHVLTVGITKLGEFRSAWNEPISLDESAEGNAAALAWLANGERGRSSEAMCHKLFGMPTSIYPDAMDAAPYDPDDFRRCHLFLQAVPEARARIGELADLSPIWAEYVGAWEQMEALYEEEARSPSKSAPKLFRLMRELRAAGEAAMRARADRQAGSAPERP